MNIGQTLEAHADYPPMQEQMICREQSKEDGRGSMKIDPITLGKSREEPGVRAMPNVKLGEEDQSGEKRQCRRY